MGFLSHRRRDYDVPPEQKWDYITLNDFKSTSCFAPFAYGYLWFSVILSMAVYAVDTFTAVNLLVFGRWASTIEPTQLISFNVSRWIFSICILLSFINLAYEHVRAQRIMKRGSVAECYLDNLAVRLESMRPGKGQGWRRFLVFAELTKSKKGAEYIALFTFFSFQSWLRVIVCSGPRQAINALTLYSVYNAKLSIEGQNFESSLMSFFDKIRALAMQDYQQALILSGMLFTLVIWIFSALSLLLAALFFVFFLLHYIPKVDGGLTGYCERKANKRLMKIVSIKINKAMAEDERRRKKAEFKAAKKNGEARPISMKATLPNVGDDVLPQMPMLGRNETTTTLPAYVSRPGTPGSFELGAVDQKPPPPFPPSRTGTMSSGVSKFSSRQPLVGAAAEPGMSRAGSPAPSLPTLNPNNYPPPPPRTGTPSSSSRSFGARPQPNRHPSNASSFGLSVNTARSPSDMMPSLPPSIRSPGPSPSNNSYRGGGPSRPSGDRSMYDDYSPSGGAGSPFPPSPGSYRGMTQSPTGLGGAGGYPPRNATAPLPPRGPGMMPPPRRNMTGNGPSMLSHHQPTDSNGSLRSTASQGQPYVFPPRAQGEYAGYYADDRPLTPSSQRGGSQRGGPRPGYANNGWNQDIERGRGPRY